MKYKNSPLVFLAVLLILSVLMGCTSPTPEPTPTPTVPPTATATQTPIPSPTPIPLSDWVQEGDALLQQSDFAGAEAAYQRAIDADPDYAPAYIALSQAYAWQIGREDETLAQAEKAVDLAPDDAAGWAALAVAHLNSDEPAEAVKAAEKAAELQSSSAEVQAVLARAYLLDRQYDAAYQAARQAVKLNADSPGAIYALSLVYWRTADFARARAALVRAVALQPQFVPWQMALGDLLAQLNLNDQAIEQFEGCLDTVPDYVPAMLELARVDIQQHDYDQAREFIEKAENLIPDAAEPYVALGDLYLSQDNYEDAVAEYRDAVDRSPDDWSVQIALADARLKQGDCESAARMFQDLSAEQPRFAEARVGNALSKLCMGDLRRSLELLRQAADLEPYDPTAPSVLGDIYNFQERWEEALRAYVETLQLSPVGTDIHAGLGSLYLEQSDYESAEAEYQVAVRLDPEAVDGQAGLCTTYLNSNETAKALPACERALALDEEDIEQRRHWAVVLLREGRSEEAVNVLEEVVTEDPEDSLAHYYLGLAYRNLEEYAQALRELKTYQKLDEVEDNARLELLIGALDQGYELRLDAAVADLAETAQVLFERPIDVRVDTSDEMTRTLTLEFGGSADEKPIDLYQGAVFLTAVAATVAPRITPPIDGGILVRVEDVQGQPFLALHADARDVQDFIDQFLAGEEFVSRLEFPRDLAEAEGSEITEDMVRTTGDAVAKLRDLTTMAPVVFQSLTQEELEERVDTSVDAQVREATRHDRALLRLLGLIGPDVDLMALYSDLEEEQVLGFYDPEDKTLSIVQGKTQGVVDRLTVAHEYVHALQDQHFGLEAVMDEELDSDRRLAFTALVEGDATLAMLNYAQEEMPIGDQVQLFSFASGDLEEEILDTSPTFIQESLLFPYDHGLEFVMNIQSAGGWEAVDDLYSAPPLSTEQILHPERYRRGDAPAAVSLPDLEAALGEDWRLVDSDVMGEFGLRLILAHHMGPAAAELAAEGWGGDRYALLQQGSDETYALVMQTVWDKQKEADEFWTLMRSFMAHRADYTEVVPDLLSEEPVRYWQSQDGYWVVSQDEDSVTIIAAPSEEISLKLLDALAGS